MTTAPPLSERDFQRQVVELARIRGWDFVYHPQLSKWSEKGWPDLTLVRVRDRRLLFVELKRDKGKLTERQVAVLGYLSAVAWQPTANRADRFGSGVSSWAPLIEVYIWRPADWPEVERVLV